MSAFLGIVCKPDFLLQPLTFYVLLAVGMGLCLFLFVTLKAEMRAFDRRAKDGNAQVRALETALDDARRNVLTLESDLREVERQTGMLVAPAPARSGLNLSKRTQVLRMHRAGQDAAGIATALGLPRAEVQLLVKVHKIAVEQI